MQREQLQVQLFTEAHSETPGAVFKRMFGAMYGLVKPVHLAESKLTMYKFNFTSLTLMRHLTSCQ